MAPFSREHVFKTHKKDNSSLLREALQEVDIVNRVHRKDQGAFSDYFESSVADEQKL